MIDYDDVLEQVGEFGPYQKWLFFLTCLPSAASAMAVFLYEFIAYTPNHRCKVDLCESGNLTYDAAFTSFAIPTNADNNTSLAKCSLYPWVLINSAATVTAGIDNCFHTCCPYIRTTVHTTFKIYVAKHNKFQVKTMFTIGETVGLDEWIIDETCLVFYNFVGLVHQAIVGIP